jgi:hypothetical protein
MQSYLKKDKVGHKFAAFCLIIFQTQMTLIIQIKNIKNPRHLRHPRQSDSKYKFSDKLGEEGLLC